MSSLQYLNAEGLKISEDLSPLSGLSALQSLSLCGTQISGDLSPLAGLSALQSLDLSGTQISGDLSPLAGLSALQSLGLSCRISWNPSALSSLSALQSLKFWRTQISGDLSALSGLFALRRLDVSYAPVSDLTPLRAWIERGGRPLLRDDHEPNAIILTGCPLQHPPPEIVGQGREAVLNYFREIDKSGDDHLYEAKMLLIGDGGNGKTSLLRRLYQPTLPLPAESETTKGIAIHRHDFPLPNGRTFRLNIWDFGGQEIYHATHQFFLTRRSLYVLVDDTRKNNKSVSDPEFRYWLDLVEVLGGASPVVLFQNEKGGRAKAIDLAGIRARYSNVAEHIHHGNLEHRDAAAGLAQAIEALAAQLPHIGDALPARWIDVRKAIEKRAAEVPYIPLSEYFETYNQFLEPSEERALHLSRYLHDLGVFLHFQDDPLLRRTVILQNEWATEAVFRVLDDEKAKINRGRFRDADCGRIWRDSVYRHMHPELLRLMEQFELCYQLRDSRPATWLATQHLPASKPGPLATWTNPGGLALRYRYTFLPKGLLSRLTVRMHRFVRDPEMAWVTGALFEWNDSQVLAELLPDGATILLRARGNEQKELLSVLAGDIEAINAGFAGLEGRVHKEVPCDCQTCRNGSEQHFFDHGKLLKRREQRIETAVCDESFEPQSVHRLLDGITVTAPPRWAEERTWRIFLASSAELRRERDAMDLYLRQENDRLRSQGIYLQVDRWENFLDAMSETRLQDEYNKKVRDCDIFLAMFFTKAGKYTIEEFRVAWAEFKSAGKPLIFTYFKDLANCAAEKSLQDFRKQLAELGHYPTDYKNTEDLQLQFRRQLDHLLT